MKISPEELKKSFIKELEKEEMPCFKECKPSDNSLMFAFGVLDEFQKFMEENNYEIRR